jgi:hypothetical protein
MFKLFRKYLVLAVLLGGLGLALSSNKNSAYAAICCSACDANYENCIPTCAFGDRDFEIACLLACEATYNHCYSGPPACNDC